MERRLFLQALMSGLLASPLAAEGQQAGRIYRLGTLALGAPPPSEMYDARRDIFEVLRDLGYVEGQGCQTSVARAGAWR